MQVPLELSFHNLESSPELEAVIRDRTEKLSRFHDRLTACRVSVEAAHQRARSETPRVRIEMSVPGRTLVVTREPREPVEGQASADLLALVRDAFRTAERQLKDAKEQLSGADSARRRSTKR